MAALIAGSVGVKQAAMTRDVTKSNRANRAFKRPEWWAEKSKQTKVMHDSPATMTHPMAIVGMTIANILLECLYKYDLGNSAPVANSPMTRTKRMISSVVSFDQDRGFTTPAPNGPIRIPKAVPRRTSFIYTCEMSKRHAAIEADFKQKPSHE